MGRRGPRIRTACSVVALGAALAAAGCGTSIAGSDPDTGLDVTVLRGPIEPVAMEGEENSEPVPGARVRVTALGASGRVEGFTGSGGTAGFTLRPGAYEVEVLECPGALALPPPVEVTIVDGSRVPLSLECDTGIR